MRSKDRKSERGVTLLETILAAAILALAAAGALHVLMVQAAAPEMEERTRRAHDAADQALEALAAKMVNLGIVSTGGGTFTVAPDNRITITGGCTTNWCDKVLVDDDGRQLLGGTSFAGGSGFNVIEPAGSRREFVRRWRVTRITGRANLREITVAVLESDTSTEPIVLQTTRVALRTP